jgi:hypothetical protein
LKKEKTMPSTRLVPESLLVVTGCGCRRLLFAAPESEIRCHRHQNRQGWKYPGDPFVILSDDIRAMETFKNLPENQDIACRSIECVNRNDDGDGWDGFCGTCCDQKREYELAEAASERAWLKKPQIVRSLIRLRSRAEAALSKLRHGSDWNQIPF